MPDKTLKYVKYLNIAYLAGNGAMTLSSIQTYIKPKYGNSLDLFHNALCGYLGVSLIFMSVDYLQDKDESSITLQKRCLITGAYSAIILALAYKYKEIYTETKFKVVGSMLGIAAVYNLYYGLLYKPKDLDERYERIEL